jgi:hypothetical protein
MNKRFGGVAAASCELPYRAILRAQPTAPCVYFQNGLQSGLERRIRHILSSYPSAACALLPPGVS